jgi:hypothetical protein
MKRHPERFMGLRRTEVNKKRTGVILSEAKDLLFSWA